MATRNWPGWLASLVLIAALLPPWRGGAAAESLQSFLHEVEAAYPSYKMAWYYARRGNGDIAALELGDFRDAWAAIVARYREAPPPPFAADREWGATLGRIGSIADRAAAEIDAGKLRAAHQTLGPIRATLSALRRRGGVSVFSDVVDAYGREVEALGALGRRIDAVTPEALAEFEALSSRLRSALGRVRSDRPPKYASDAGFDAAVDGNFNSLAKLDRGIASRHLRAIQGSIRSIRADYVLLFIRYG